MYLSLPSQVLSSWNLKLKLLESQLVNPTYPGHPLCYISTPSGTLWNPSRAILWIYHYQINLLFNTTWNLSFWGPNYLFPLILVIPLFNQLPLKPFTAPLEPSFSISLAYRSYRPLVLFLLKEIWQTWWTYSEAVNVLLSKCVKIKHFLGNCSFH